MSKQGLDAWIKGVLHYGDHLPGDTEHPLEILVLRGHLLVEEEFRKLVQSRFMKPEVFDLSRFPFSSLVRLAHALYGDELPQWLWDRAKELNTIRNSTAHNLQNEMLRPQIERFIEKFRKLDAATFEHVSPSLPGQLAYCLAHLHHTILRLRHLPGNGA